ncbi:LOW QUALITY PROTEIN: protocadherin alpha-6-like [Carlito syrichta]|uniref:LOW QUALITY PROTEIN: protocadherin alpha-6-like n=1 Tax=Carlito syrichta TaxID=1868482 RepID=A0A3Q0DKP4_CARSF|nr:LOW QUALITY PROTEIN: protocadherin alpha-6-like [Carlito syrichta]
MVFTLEDRRGTRCLLLLLLVAAWEAGSGQLHYSVPEEAKHGTFVGRIAQDLGLELAQLVPRLFRVASKGRGDLLEVNLQNGILFVNSRIDREELCGRSLECSIHLEVLVERPLQVFHVEVEVRDINDNPPVFPVEEQRVLIYESRLPDYLFPLEGASDADVGSNSILTYKLSSSEYFVLDVKTDSADNKQVGLLLRKALDREDAPEHSLLLTATDGGKPELTGSVQLLVAVLDVNDNAPAFERSEYEVRIFENSDNGTTMIRLNASDRDEGANGAISYSFNSLVPTMIMEQFSIDPNTGEIVTQGNLDFEQVKLYKIRIDATDKGHPPMVGHCTVLVRVWDKNDNVPQITTRFSDRKRVFNMVYSWRRDSGSQRLLLSLLFLAAWEAGSGQLHYSVPEEAKHGTFVGRIAQDLGLELAQLVPRLFRVASKDRGDLLEVNLQNGILFVNSRIDREELCGRSLECSIHLEVLVDRPLQVFHVEVEVRDINDNPPVFPVKEQMLFVSESRMPDSRFPLEGASDADVGSNAFLTYRLSSNDYFTLDVNSKNDQNKLVELVLRKALDREDAPEHSLFLTATDGGKPELTGSVQLLVAVLDVNDNAPAFERSEYEVRIFENSDNGTTMIRLNASDRDEGANGAISYSFNSLVPTMIMEQFIIDPNTGEIRIKGRIDFEESATHKIQIEAVDKGPLPLAGHCTVLVEVVDANDNAPQLTVKTLLLPIKEDAQLGTAIALISVTDLDSGANGQVTCSLTPQVPFKLAPTFKNYYSLVLDGALDRESVSAYQLVVTARDGGSPSRWATASVAVEVADVNDNAPAFAQPEYTVFVKENNPPGCHVFTVSTMLLYTALRCSAPPPEGACGPGKPPLVCSSAAGSWSSSRPRRQRVCSGEGPPKTDLMAFSPGLPPCPVVDAEVDDQSIGGDHSRKMT